MKNLKICNLKELNSFELKRVEGGSSVGTWAGRILGFAFRYYNDPAGLNNAGAKYWAQK